MRISSLFLLQASCCLLLAGLGISSGGATSDGHTLVAHPHPLSIQSGLSASKAALKKTSIEENQDVLRIFQNATFSWAFNKQEHEFSEKEAAKLHLIMAYHNFTGNFYLAKRDATEENLKSLTEGGPTVIFLDNIEGNLKTYLVTGTANGQIHLVNKEGDVHKISFEKAARGWDGRAYLNLDDLHDLPGDHIWRPTDKEYATLKAGKALALLASKSFASSSESPKEIISHSKGAPLVYPSKDTAISSISLVQTTPNISRQYPPNSLEFSEAFPSSIHISPIIPPVNPSSQETLSLLNPNSLSLLDPKTSLSPSNSPPPSERPPNSIIKSLTPIKQKYSPADYIEAWGHRDLFNNWFNNPTRAYSARTKRAAIEAQEGKLNTQQTIHPNCGVFTGQELFDLHFGRSVPGDFFGTAPLYSSQIAQRLNEAARALKIENGDRFVNVQKSSTPEALVDLLTKHGAASITISTPAGPHQVTVWDIGYTPDGILSAYVRNTHGDLTAAPLEQVAAAWGGSGGWGVVYDPQGLEQPLSGIEQYQQSAPYTNYGLRYSFPYGYTNGYTNVPSQSSTTFQGYK